MNLADFQSMFAGTPYTRQAAPGILSGQPASGGPLSGGGYSLASFLDPQVALPIAAQLMAGRNLQQSLAGGLAAAGPALADAQKRKALNGWFKAKSSGDPAALEQATNDLFAAAPDLAEKYVGSQIAPAPVDLTAEQKNYRAGLKDPKFAAYEKSLHPTMDEDSPLNTGRWTLAANRAVAPYTKLSAYNLIQNAQPYMSRIAAMENLPSGSLGDRELLDTMTKLATGGNQVTEAQVNTVLRGQSLADKINVWQKYMSENGGVLSDDQRRQIQAIAHAVYGGYQKLYQPIYDAAIKSMKDRGIPEKFWGAIPDLNALSGGAGIDFSTGSPTGGGQPSLQTINDPAEAMKLPSGTHFLTPDGREKVRP